MSHSEMNRSTEKSLAEGMCAWANVLKLCRLCGKSKCRRDFFHGLARRKSKD
jgi:hypothetical protein